MYANQIIDNRFAATGAADIATILESAFPQSILVLLIEHDVKIVPIGKTSYVEASPAIRSMGIDVDAWPIPPAGLFVVAERTVYIRAITRMTVVHEVGHAIDCALGGGIYRSGFDVKIRRAYANARDFVTPYAASGIDEYFAESMRAFTDRGNDPKCSWIPATRERLAKIDPTMFSLLSDIVAEVEQDFNAARAGEQLALFAA